MPKSTVIMHKYYTQVLHNHTQLMAHRNGIKHSHGGECAQIHKLLTQNIFKRLDFALKKRYTVYRV